MIRSRFICAVLASLLISLAGCQTGDTTIGQQIITPNTLDITGIDTTTVQTATVLSDSFFTYSDANVLIGRWVSATTGKTQAKGFVSIGYPANSLSTQTGLVYDSLVMILPIGFAYGDTTSSFTLNVHRTGELFKNRAYSNLSAISYEPTPYLTQTVVGGTNTSKGAYRLRLSPAIQQEFVSKITNRDIENQQELDAYLKGFALVATPSTNVMVGINTTSVDAGLTLYYHNSDLVPISAKLVFPFKTQDPQIGTGHFSQVLTDRSQTPLAGLTNRSDAVLSARTENQAFVIPSAQVTTRLTIPTFDRYALGNGQFRGVNHAELILEPVWPNTRDNAPPFTSLYLYQTNNSNQLTDINGNAIGLVQSGSGPTVSATLINYASGALLPDLSYRFNITYYVNEIIAGRTPNRSILITTTPVGQQLNLQPLVQRLAFGNASNGEYRLRLALYITTEQ